MGISRSGQISSQLRIVNGTKWGSSCIVPKNFKQSSTKKQPYGSIHCPYMFCIVVYHNWICQCCIVMPRKEMQIRHRFKRFFKAIKRFRKVRDEESVRYAIREKYCYVENSYCSGENATPSKRKKRYLIRKSLSYLVFFLHSEKCSFFVLISWLCMGCSALSPSYNENSHSATVPRST